VNNGGGNLLTQISEESNGGAAVYPGQPHNRFSFGNRKFPSSAFFIRIS
jgi:hypothetical protein